MNTIAHTMNCKMPGYCYGTRTWESLTRISQAKHSHYRGLKKKRTYNT